MQLLLGPPSAVEQGARRKKMRWAVEMIISAVRDKNIHDSISMATDRREQSLISHRTPLPHPMPVVSAAGTSEQKPFDSNCGLEDAASDKRPKFTLGATSGGGDDISSLPMKTLEVTQDVEPKVWHLQLSEKEESIGSKRGQQFIGATGTVTKNTGQRK